MLAWTSSFAWVQIGMGGEDITGAAHEFAPPCSAYPVDLHPSAVRVTVSVMGRFHAFDLAGQHARRGHLHQLVPSYPRFVAARWGIPRQRISSVLSTALPRRGVRGP